MEFFQTSLANYKAIASLLVVNNRGALVSYKASDEELEIIKKALKVSPLRGSISLGSQFIKLGVIANDKGCVVNSLTTGFELSRVEEALDLIKN